MNARNHAFKCLVALCVVLGLCQSSSLIEAQTAKATDIAVVVHPDTPVTNLSLADVRKVFRGDRQYWTNDIPVVIIMRAPVSREREVVLRTIFQMNDAQFKQFWVAKIFRAETTSAPKIVYSNTVANQLVAAVPGAIAFIEAREVKPGVKVVTVDGISPGQPKYPLH